MAETLNPVPKCESCGEETRRIKSTAGKGRYQCTNETCPNKTWYIRGSKKKEEQDTLTPEEREEMMARIDGSILQDFNGSRRRYADTVSTSQALRQRANEARAERNGHE